MALFNSSERLNPLLTNPEREFRALLWPLEWSAATAMAPPNADCVLRAAGKMCCRDMFSRTLDSMVTLLAYVSYLGLVKRGKKQHHTTYMTKFLASNSS